MGFSSQIGYSYSNYFKYIFILCPVTELSMLLCNINASQENVDISSEPATERMEKMDFRPNENGVGLISLYHEGDT